ANAAAAFLEDLARPCGGVQSRGVWPHCRKDGTRLEVEIAALDLKYADAPARLIVVNDITMRRRHEHELLQTQKMEIIGRISGGVGEQVNQILGGISAHATALSHTA